MMIRLVWLKYYSSMIKVFLTLDAASAFIIGDLNHVEIADTLRTWGGRWDSLALRFTQVVLSHFHAPLAIG